MIVIFSSARSGSTWLGKILDSHPDTIYLHEPDIVDRGVDLLPYWFEKEPTEEQVDRAGIYIERLCKQRSLRAVGSRPFFSKNYRSDPMATLRKSLIILGKAIERGLSVTEGKVTIPDLSSRDCSPHVVMKSVSALGRADVLMRGAPKQIKPILLVRHPCAIVSSFVRGISSGAMAPPPEISKVLNTCSGRALVPHELPDDLDVVDRLAWAWVIANAEAMKAVKAVDGIVLRYEDLAADPTATSHDIFERLGLEWSDGTTKFLNGAAKAKQGYYSLSRDSKEAAVRWKSRMDPETFARVRHIVCRHPLGQGYFDS